MIDWHRLFGLILMDYFTNTPFNVEVESDLSVQQQYLDVVVLRKRSGVYHGRLPDGFDPLFDHNLISFKSHQEAFSSWSLAELLGHYVNYRKLVSNSSDDLLPTKHFRLFAFVVRYPKQLASETPLHKVAPGVYDWKEVPPGVRVVVGHELPQEEHNALCLLFSAQQKPVLYAGTHYEKRSSETSGLLNQLLNRYREEGLAVPYTLEDFRRDYIKSMSIEERLEGIDTRDLVQARSPEEIARALPREVLEAQLRHLLESDQTDVPETDVPETDEDQSP